MFIEAGKFGSENNFSIPFTEAVKSMKDGDTLVFEKKRISFLQGFQPIQRNSFYQHGQF